MAMFNAIGSGPSRSLAGAAWRALAPGRAHDHVPDPARESARWGVKPGAGMIDDQQDAASARMTTPALLLSDLIHRMGGAETSNAKGVYVNLRV